MAESTFDWTNMVPQGEITLTEFEYYASVRLADGEEFAISGDGRMSVSLPDGRTINLPPLDALIANL